MSYSSNVRYSNKKHQKMYNPLVFFFSKIPNMQLLAAPGTCPQPHGTDKENHQRHNRNIPRPINKLLSRCENDT